MPNARLSETVLDALTLTEPLACVMHAYRRLPESLHFQTVLILGGGPIGVLHALEIHRRYPHAHTTIVEPNALRRKTLRKRFSEFSIIQKSRGLTGFDLIVVATSEPVANVEAVRAAADAGIVLLFSGLNHLTAGELPIFEGINFETIHRNEEIRVTSRSIRLIGSSGFNHSDIELSLKQLFLSPEYYTRVQTVIVNGLHTNVMGLNKFANSVIETMLNNKRAFMAELKTLFRLGNEPYGVSVTPNLSLTEARLREVTLNDSLQPGAVRLKMLRTSICQTDRRVLLGAKTSLKTDQLILGHEGVGRVEAVGGQSGVSTLIGKIAVVLPHYIRTDDDLGRRGLGFLSQKMEHLGIHRDGLFATQVVIPESCIYVVD